MTKKTMKPQAASHVRMALWSCVGGELHEQEFFVTPKGAVYTPSGGLGFLSLKAAARAGLHVDRAGAVSQYLDQIKRRHADLSKKVEQAQRLLDQAMELDRETASCAEHEARVAMLMSRKR